MEEDSNVSLIPYAKRSKMVSRNTLEKDPNMASADCSHSDFWDRLIRQQSSHWMDEYHEAPSLLMSGCVAERPVEAEGGPFHWQVLSAEQKLPSPKELCRRKKKGAKQQRLEKGGVLSVCYHLEELKRRQSSIDELKKAKWGGHLHQPFHEGDNSVTGSHRGMPWSPFGIPGSAAHFYEEKEDLVFQRHSDEQAVYPEWNSGARAQQRIPPESPIFSYTMAALGRRPVAAACKAEEDFEGFHLLSEE
ncbi:protein INCA1 [Heteronotia binoei]|uniref:protein INCA1 n=1 Tax=Heteronotia binoei TaxID=13085 RepID=UPI00292E380F|nr:protein INCA1 [Heteronotia binoei]